MSLTPAEVFDVIFWVVTGVVTVLLFGNFFFIKRLVHKIESVDDIALQVASMSAKLVEIIHQTKGLADLRVEVASIKERLAVQMRRDLTAREQRS